MMPSLTKRGDPKGGRGKLCAAKNCVSVVSENGLCAMHMFRVHTTSLETKKSISKSVSEMSLDHHSSTKKSTTSSTTHIKKQKTVKEPKKEVDTFSSRDFLYLNELMYSSDMCHAELLQNIVNATSALIKCELLCFFEYDIQNEKLICVAEKSVHSTQDKNKTNIGMELGDKGMSSFVQKSGRIVNILNPIVDWRYDLNNDNRRTLTSINSVMIIPVRNKTKCLGVFEAWNKIDTAANGYNEKGFGINDENILKSVSCAVSGQIQHIIMEKKIQVRNKRLQALDEITSLTSYRLPLDHAIEKILLSIKIVLPGLSHGFYMIDESRSFLIEYCRITQNKNQNIDNDNDNDITIDSRASQHANHLRVLSLITSLSHVKDSAVTAQPIYFNDYKSNKRKRFHSFDSLYNNQNNNNCDSTVDNGEQSNISNSPFNTAENQQRILSSSFNNNQNNNLSSSFNNNQNNNVAQDMSYNENTTSIMVVPVKDYLGKVIGVIEICRDDTLKFVNEDVKQLESLAVAVTGVIKQSQLSLDAIRSKEEANDLRQVSDLLACDVGTSMLIPRIMHAAYKLVSADRVSMFNIEDFGHFTSSRRSSISHDINIDNRVTHEHNRRKTLVCIVSKDKSMEGRKIAWGKGLVGHVAMTLEVVNVPNAYKDPRFLQSVDESTQYKTISILTVPVIDRNGKGVAVIQAINKHGINGNFIPFNAHDESMLQSLAVSAGAAIQKWKMFYITKCAERKSTALLSLLKLNFSTISFIKAVKEISNITKKALDCEKASLLFVNDKEETMFSLESGDRKRGMYNLNVGIAGFCARNGYPVNVQQAFADPRFDINVDQVDNCRIYSLLYVPIVDNNGKTLAVMQCINKKGLDIKRNHSVSMSTVLKMDTRSKSNNKSNNNSNNNDNNIEEEELLMAYSYFTPDDEDLLQTIAVRVLHAIRQLHDEADALVHKRDERITALINIYKKSVASSDSVERLNSPRLHIDTDSINNRPPSVVASPNWRRKRLNADSYAGKRLIEISRLIIAFGDPSDARLESGIQLLRSREFNVFDYNKEELCCFAYIMLKKALNDCGIQYNVDDKVIQMFILLIESGYKNNPYHNFFHGIGVMQFSYYVIEKQPELLSPILRLALLLASLGHDVDHPGLTNSFLVSTSHELSIIYNDKSVLENHHASLTCRLLQQLSSNVLINFNEPELVAIRAAIIDGILATDMSVHFDMIKALNNIEIIDNEKTNAQLLFNSILHCSDIAGQVFPMHIAELWEARISKEFESQAIEEEKLGMTVASFMKGLNNYGIRMKLHLGFIDFVLNPWYNNMARLMTALEEPLQQLLENREIYKKRSDEYNMNHPPGKDNADNDNE